MSLDQQTKSPEISGSYMQERLESWYDMFRKMGNGGHAIVLENPGDLPVLDSYKFPLDGRFEKTGENGSFFTFAYIPKEMA